MFPVYLKAGLKFKVNNDVYEILKILSNGNTQVQNEIFGDIKIFTKKELINLLEQGVLKFEVNGKNSKLNEKETIKTSFDFNDLKNVKHKEQAIFKFEVIKPLLEIPTNIRKSKDIENRVSLINSYVENPTLQKDLNFQFTRKISRASVYRWLSDYETSGGDIFSLIPSYHRSGAKNIPRLQQQIIGIINETIKENYLNNQRITIKDLHLYIVNKISEYNQFAIEKLKYPSYRTIARYVSKIPEYEFVATRFGERSAEHKFKPVGKGVDVSYPLERVEIDATDLDLIVLSSEGLPIGRPYFIVAIDKFSRQILGFSLGFGGVGWPEVMQCLRHVMTDKSYIKEKYPFIENDWTAFGVPKTIVVDNGLGFKNNPMKDASYQLGFVIQYAPPRMPEWKGSIERFFGTSNSSFIHNLPGTTRSHPKQLGDLEVPENKACLPFSVFLGLLHKWIIDVYSQDLNKGCGGIPSKIWEKAINENPVAWPNNTDELAILLGRIEYRHIRNKGIELYGLYYNSSRLNQLYTKFSLENRGQEHKFKVKYDPHNLGKIYLYDHIFEREWIKVPAIDLNYSEGLSEWEHKEIRSHARLEYGQVDIEALASSKAYLKKQVDNWTGFTKKQLAKAKKINSTQDIFSCSNTSLNTSPVKLRQPKQRHIDNLNNNSKGVSDIGNTINIVNSVSPIISSNNTMIQESSKPKIIEIKNQKKKNKKNKIISSKTLISDDTLTEDDLIGFEVISYLGGVRDDK